MVEREQLERSKTIQRRTGRTFYFATRLLPERIRHATYVLYAFFGLVDDIVDDPNPHHQLSSARRSKTMMSYNLSQRQENLTSGERARGEYEHGHNAYYPVRCIQQYG